MKFSALGLCLLCGLAVAAPVQVSSQRLTIELDPDDGYAVTGLTHRDQHLNFIAPRPTGVVQDRTLWQLEFRGATGSTYLTPAWAKHAEHRVDGNTLTIVWSQFKDADLTVTATITPRPDGDTAWGLALKGQFAGALWHVDYPRVYGLRSLGDDQLAWPQYLGRLVTSPAQHKWRQRLDYPQPASMQFVAYWGSQERVEPEFKPLDSGVHETGWSIDRSRDAGLYWATEDGRGYIKDYTLDCGAVKDQFAWSLGHLPELATWPTPAGLQPVDYVIPYPIVLDAFTGDYHEASRKYLRWAKDQIWLQRGSVDTWPLQQPTELEALVNWIPPWFREVGFWAKFYQEPAKILPEWSAYQRWLGVPLASHYYRHPISFFDDNYPEHLPADPYFLQGVRDAKALGVRPLPYVQGSIWDTDTQSWRRENGLAAAAKTPAGDFYPWDIHGEILAHLCPATKQWQAKMSEVGEKLVGEHGCSGIYLDVLVAERPYPCFDSSHGHPLHGGTYWGQGKRQLLHDLRARVRRVEPDACFFSEECGELYIDGLDGHLTLDQLRFNSGVAGMQNWPLFPAVYHPYTMYFGCDAIPSQDPDFFTWEMAQMLTWGAVPLNSHALAPDPKPGDPSSELLREVVRAYYQAGRRFLHGGTMERLAVRPLGTPPGAAPLQLATKPHRLEYTVNKRQRCWDGPAVMASAWSFGERLGIVMVNLTATEQPVELLLRNQPDAKLWQTWPSIRQLAGAEGEHQLSVGPRKALILEIGRDTPAPLAPLVEPSVTFEAVVDGPFPPVDGPAGTLYACDDGPVQLKPTARGVQAQALWVGDQGTLQPRVGHQAAVRGAKAEGHGLPREASAQPFLLLHTLPHTVTGGSALVYAGGDRFLCAVVDGGTTLKLAQPGLLAVRDVLSGNLIRGLEQPLVSEFRLPAGGPYLCGHADPAALTSTLGHKSLDAALKSLSSGPAKGRPQALAVATGALCELAKGLGQRLDAFVPGRELARLNQTLQALAAPYTGWRLRAGADHDWLAPEIPKEVQLTAWSPGAGIAPVKVNASTVGDWPSRTLNQPALWTPAQWQQAVPLSYRFAVGEVVERLAPVVTEATVEAAGESFRLVDWVLLEANRPVEVRTQSATLTSVSGRTATGETVLRNWSPYPVSMKLSASGPDGWQLVTEPAELDVPALSDRKVALAVTPPRAAARGSYQVTVTANHSASPATAIVGRIKVGLSRALEPLSANGTWQPTAPDQVARLRQRGKVVVYLNQGESADATVENKRVSIYSNSLAYRVLDPDLREVEKGSIPVDDTKSLKLTALEAGVYTLELVPGSGSAIVHVQARPVAEQATKDDPLMLFTSPLTRYFYVPHGSTGFQLGYRDGGPDETAHLVITSSKGRVAYDYAGNSGGQEYPVEVRAGEDGSIWTISIDPRQDMQCWLTGDVSPYLSTSKERVLREAE